MIEYVVVRDENRKQIGIVDLFSSVIWSRRFYGVGDFEIYAAATPRHVELLKEGNFITRDSEKEVGIIEHLERKTSLIEGEMLVASGRFAKSILDRRIIYNLSGTTNKATVISGNVETAARNLVQAHTFGATDTARRIGFIALAEHSGSSKTIVDENGEAAEKQTSYSNLLSYTDELLEEYELGSMMSMDADKNLRYSVFEGKDRSRGNIEGNTPVIFSPVFDNLLDFVYNFDNTALKTTALIGGAGEDVERFYSLYAGGYTGMRRREVFIDARTINKKYRDDNDTEQEYSDSVYKKMLNSHARQELEPLAIKQSVSANVDVSSSKYHYKKDFDLGDIVTVDVPSMGVSIAARILKVNEVQDAAGYRITVDFKS